MDMRWNDLLSGSLLPGVYRLDTELSQPQNITNGDAPYHLTLPKLMDVEKKTLLHALAKSLAFPDYFGDNWDAAYDCLTDRQWPAGSTVLIEIPLSPTAAAGEDALTIFVAVLRDACRFWSEQKVNLYFLFICPGKNLDFLSQVQPLQLM